MEDAVYEEEDRDTIPSSPTTHHPPPTRKAYSLRHDTHHSHARTRNHSLNEDELPLSSPHNIRYDHSFSLPIITSPSSPTSALPEFTAAGGTGIFKPPTRAAVHPTRPPALELRPHPLRETQVGKFLRTIGCTDTQLWAGQENGVRFWRFQDAYKAGPGFSGRVRRGDEDTAPFYESANTSPTYSLEVDHGNRLVWTGHKDGKIRCWKMDQSAGDTAPFRDGISWVAHKGPVLSLAISCYGDIWSGGEGGVIKIWPWENIEKSLSLSSDERHMASLLVERSGIDLRSQVTVNGVCHLSSSDVKVILSDHARARVWCAASLSFSLWDARTKELVKVFNIDGHIENRAEMPVPQDQQIETDEMKVKFVSTSSKKEKPHGFLQRSRNALIGAADAVRRAASRGTGAFNEDSKKTEAMVLTPDGRVWSGCSNGMLVQWDSNGNRGQEFQHHPTAVLCFCTHGSQLWVGYASGLVQLLDLEGNVISGWVAHSSPVIKMAVGGGYVFSMAIHGGIRGWNLTSPGPIDSILRAGLTAKELLYTRKESVKILVGTWNVGQGKPNPLGLRSWLGSAVSDVGIVVVGLQEVEMGAGFLAMSAAKETVGLEGSAIGQTWQDAIGKVLEEGPIFERVGSRQLAGLLIAIWVRKDIRMHVGDLDVAAVACGFGRTIGNKGGVGLRLRVHDRIICFVNCHLAAHLEAVNRRNADFNHIYRTMVFSRQSHLLNVAAAGAASASQALRANVAIANSDQGRTDVSDQRRTDVSDQRTDVPDQRRTDLSGADMVVFCGDFNYRLFGISYDEARDLVSQRSFDWLREKDQLRAEMRAGKVFQGMREAVVKFPPTYKFERHAQGLGGYDSGEKKRIPAWCDRVIYRDCRSGPGPVSECSLNCPVLGSIQMYEACLDVTDSDHKPVRSKFSVHLARVDRSVRRKEFGDIMKSSQEVKNLLDKYSVVPEVSVSTDSIILQNQETCSLHIANKSNSEKAAVRILCEGQYPVYDDGKESEIRHRASFGFPTWLEVTPACGIINPEESMEVMVRHTEFHTVGEVGEGVPQNWWSEDTRDKAVILRVQIHGIHSMETRKLQVHVRHCYSAKKPNTEARTSSARRPNNGAQHRSDRQSS